MKPNRMLFLFIPLLIILSALSLMPRYAQADNSNQSNQINLPASFQITSADNDELSLTVSAPFYQFRQKQIGGQQFDTISVPGAQVRTTTGLPELPIVSTLIGIPPQAEISLEINSDRAQKIEGQFRIANAPAAARLADDQEATELWDYAQIVPVDTNQSVERISPVRIAEEAWIRDQRVVRIEYTPFEYNSNTGQLTWHPEVEFRLHFSYLPKKTPEVLENAVASISDHPLERLLKENLLNYEQAIQWRELPETASAHITPPGVGPRYRIAIQENGIYKLTYEELVSANPAIGGVNSQLLHMTSQGEDIAIQVVDPNGNFGSGDYIIFYGQRFYGDRLADLYQDENIQYRIFTQQQTDGTYQLWKPKFNAIMLEKYTYENIYWLYVGSTNGLRMATADGDPSGNSNSPVPYYRETVRGEESTIWKTTTFTGEDTWFWQRMQQNDIFYPFTTTASSVATGGPNAIVRGELVSAVNNSATGFDHHSKIYFNSTTITLEDTWWSGASRYHFEHEVTNNPTTILNGTNTLRVLMAHTDQIVFPDYYFDWFEIEYNRLFQAKNNAITFS
ncbi:MAG: C25 family peptidase propeptide domain-containing protein, partial [Anaerolineales bacterium]